MAGLRTMTRFQPQNVTTARDVVLTSKDEREVEHGSRSSYTNRGCRCMLCRESERIYARERNSLRQYGPRKMTHGTLSGYDYHGCRCEACKFAVKHYAHQRRPLTLEARRRNYLRKAYGLTPEDIPRMMAAQYGRCPICNEELRAYGSTGRSGYTHVDHDHVTGKVRGLVCNACNQGMGKFKDKAEYLEKAAAYIRSTGHTSTQYEEGHGSV